jgi:hypothetical protein
MLTNLELDRQSGRMPVVRLKNKRGRLSIDIPRPHFETAFRDFTNAAEHFAIHLSDALDRKFAYQYLEYVQEVARGSELVKPNPIGRPACRLICYELERLFRCHFFRPCDCTSI